MNKANLEQSSQTPPENSTDFHGASIITQAGEEIPITEQMLQRSFDTLIKAWEKLHPGSPLSH